MTQLIVIPNPLAIHEREIFEVGPGSLWSALRAAYPAAREPDAWTLLVDGVLATASAELEDCDRVVVATQIPHGPEAAAFAAKAIFAAAASFAVSRIFAPPPLPRIRGDRASATYSYDGIEANRVEGLPIQVLYGEMRVGGQVINEYVDVQGTGAGFTTDLYQLISFGEGPVAAIGGVTVDTDGLTGDQLPTGILINGNPAENFDDIEVSVRMGSNEQTTIPGFHKLYTSSEVDQDITAEKSSDSNDVGDLYVTGSPYGTSWNDQWDEHGIEFDITTPSDGFRLRIQFTQGLWTANEDDGSIDFTPFDGQIRYRELDSGNNPITTGGPNGDGWFRITPEPTLLARSRSPFEVDIEHAFNDPQGTNWIPGTGFALEGTNANGSLDYATIPTGASNPYNDGTVVEEFTVSCWVKIGSFPASPANADELYVFSTYQAGTASDPDTGVDLYFKYGTYGAGTGWALSYRIGGVNQQYITVRNQATPTLTWTTGQWYLFTGTYKKQIGGPDLARVYIDGYIEASGSASSWNNVTALLSKSGGTIVTARVLWGRNIAGAKSDFDLDDLLLMDRFVGLGTHSRWFISKQTRAAEQSALSLHKFDDDATGPSSSTGEYALQSITVNGNKLWEDMILGSANIKSGQATGVVLEEQAGTPKRMRARVGLLRINYDSTNKDVYDDARWIDIAAYTDVALTYPNLALASFRGRATEQFAGSVPDVTWLVKGRFVPVWDGQSLTDPSISYVWSPNPAWIALDIATHPRYGMGEQYSFFDTYLAEFKALANYSDEVIYDGSPLVGPDGTTLGGWTNLYFNADAVDPVTGNTRGAVYLVGFTSPLPANYIANGRTFVRFSGVNQPGGTTNINNASDEPGGYEIAEVGWNIDTVTAAWMVKVWWDKGSPGPWNDDAFLSAQVTVAGYSTSASRRFEFHGVYDEESNAWDSLNAVLSVARAVPVPRGNRLGVVYAHPLAAGEYAHFFVGRGSIEDNSFTIEYTGPQHKPNAYEMEFLDATDNHERNVWRANSPDLTNAQTATIRDYRIASAFLFGVTSRAQAERAANYLINVNRYQKRSGSFTLTPEGLPLEAGDIILISHDILPRGVSGRVRHDASLDSQNADYHRTHLPLDEAFTIEPSTTYYLYVRDHRTDDTERATVVLGQGNYSAGTIVEVTGGPHSSGGFTSGPDPGATTYTLVKSGDELRGIVTRVVQREDLRKDVEWLEYNDLIFVDDATETPAESFFSEDGGVNSPTGEPWSGTHRYEDSRPLDGPNTIRIDEVVTALRGARAAKLEVSWTWTRTERQRVARVYVYGRRTPTMLAAVDRGYETGWQLLGAAEPAQDQITVDIPAGTKYGDMYEVAVQGATLTGVRRRPERCPRVSQKFQGRGMPLPRLSNLVASSNGNLARYSWTFPTDGETQSVELRRGGWVLGELIARVNGERTEYIDDIAGAVSGDEFAIYAARRDAANQYSTPVSLMFTPDPAVMDEGFDADFAAQAWEEYVDGWKTDGTAPLGDPQLSNLQRHADGYLYWSGSSLNATYTTWDYTAGAATISRPTTPQPVLVEAAVQAEQIDPLTWEQASWTWGEPTQRRRSWEGNRWLIGTERQVTCRIEWRLSRDGSTYSEWQRFTPGVYSLAVAQFRLVLSRPSSSYDARIHRFHTRIRYVQERITDASRRTSYLLRELS